MFDVNVRMKICEHLPIDTLLDCRKINHSWKYSVESFMMDKLLKEIGIKRLFLKNFEACDMCNSTHIVEKIKTCYGPSITWGIKEYRCCNQCLHYFDEKY